MRGFALCSSGIVRALGAVVIPFALLGWQVPGSAASGTVDRETADVGHGSRFDDWDVRVTPSKKDPQVLTVKFDSPLLDRRVVNTVFVPDNYQRSGSPSSVLYSLHGTVFPEFNSHALDPITANEALLSMTGAAGGYHQTALSGFDSQLDRANFLVVAPDTTRGEPWCETCTWIDGRDSPLAGAGPVAAETLPADSFLHEELYPLVESLFNVRTDRGGRGVTGFSMGGWGAMLQGFKHPDRYGFVASVSGVYDPLADPDLRTVLDAHGWMRDQGYGTSVTHNVWWKNFSPAEMMRNVKGTNQRVVMSTGDACLGSRSATHAHCRATPPLTNPAATVIETMIARQTDRAREDAKTQGIPVEFVESPGVHGSNNRKVYADDILPAANARFARDVPEPTTFDYRAAEDQFSVWGYHVSVDRPRDEFLTLRNARTDGRGFTVSGSGVMEVRTPSTFRHGSRHQVVVRYGAGEREATTRTVGDAGILTVQIDLSNAGRSTASVAID